MEILYGQAHFQSVADVWDCPAITEAAKKKLLSKAGIAYQSMETSLKNFRNKMLTEIKHTCRRLVLAKYRTGIEQVEGPFYVTA